MRQVWMLLSGTRAKLMLLCVVTRCIWAAYMLSCSCLGVLQVASEHVSDTLCHFYIVSCSAQLNPPALCDSWYDCVACIMLIRKE
jgi:hypothetical protein